VIDPSCIFERFIKNGKLGNVFDNFEGD